MHRLLSARNAAVAVVLFIAVSPLWSGHVSQTTLTNADDWDQTTNGCEGDDDTIGSDDLPCADDEVRAATTCSKINKSPEDMVKIEIATDKSLIDTSVDHIDIAFSACHASPTACIAPYIDSNSISTTNEICQACSVATLTFNLTAGFKTDLNSTADCVTNNWCFRIYEDGCDTGDFSYSEADVFVTTAAAGRRRVMVVGP